MLLWCTELGCFKSCTNVMTLKNFLLTHFVINFHSYLKPSQYFAKLYTAEEYLEPSRTSTMEDFAKMVNGYPEVFCKKSVLVNFAKFTG